MNTIKNFILSHSFIPMQFESRNEIANALGIPFEHADMLDEKVKDYYSPFLTDALPITTVLKDLAGDAKDDEEFIYMLYMYIAIKSFHLLKKSLLEGSVNQFLEFLNIKK